MLACNSPQFYSSVLGPRRIGLGELASSAKSILLMDIRITATLLFILTIDSQVCFPDSGF